MIIDSRAHYTNSAYRKLFRYLSYDEAGYALKEGERAQLLQKMKDAGILYSIEAGVSLQSCEEILQWSKQLQKTRFAYFNYPFLRRIYHYES